MAFGKAGEAKGSVAANGVASRGEYEMVASGEAEEDGRMREGR